VPNFIPEDRVEQTQLPRLQRVHGYDVLEGGTAEREDLADGSGRTDKREASWTWHPADGRMARAAGARRQSCSRRTGGGAEITARGGRPVGAIAGILAAKK